MLARHVIYCAKRKHCDYIKLKITALIRYLLQLKSFLNYLVIKSTEFYVGISFDIINNGINDDKYLSNIITFNNHLVSYLYSDFS